MDCEELEIVQYKFASIIGGLCGKPKILSQFAVWLDLRLAEYKLKGAISLDCSGSTPDPDWLQGIKPDLSQQTQTFLSEHASVEQTEVSVLYGDGTHHSPSEQSIQPEQIKAEPYTEERVFPVEQYENVSFSGTNNSQSTPVKYRERTEHFTPPSSKHRKVVPSTSSKEDFADVHAGTTLGSAAEPLEVTIDDDSESYESFTAGISGDISQAPSTSAEEAPSEFNLECYQSGEWSTADRGMGYINTRKHQLENNGTLSSKTIRNVLAAVSSLERWLFLHPAKESRLLEKIPPGEMDSYLKDYFMSVKKPSGQDYTFTSFASLRTGIECYLKEKRYPESISHSPLFHATRTAFRNRKRELERAYADQMRSVSNTTVKSSHS